MIQAVILVVELLLGAVGLWLLDKWVRPYLDSYKVNKLGGHAPIRRDWIPLGVGLITDAVAHAVANDNLKLWHKNFMTWGNPNNPYTIESYTLGQRIILTADPENIKAILATQFQEFGKGPRFNYEWHDFLGNGIFAADGQTWHDSRQLIRPQFVKDRVSDLETFEHHVINLLQQIKGNGQTVDIKDLFFRYTLDAATDFLFGRSTNSLNNSSVEFAHAFAEIQRVQSLISRAGPAMVFIPRTDFKRNLKILNNFVQPYIDEALAIPPDELEKRTKDSSSKYTFLHAIAAYTRDPVVLRDQLVSILLAGRDTTACTLSWLFFELSRNPQIVDNLRREILDTVGTSRAPTYRDLKEMRYLQHTLNETLRLYPVVPFNVRVALKDTTIPHGGGPDGNSPIGVTKDTPVGYSTHYMQLREDLYPAPSEKVAPFDLFSPERWDHWQPTNWTYIPFNGGPRICVGQQFALTEMGYTVVRVLQQFSRVESRMGDARTSSSDGGNVLQTQMDVKRPWKRRDGNVSMVEKSAIAASQVSHKSEIVLQPSREVHVAFYQ